jgi:LuxR family transcriptional regulator, regulator of acetate metabolism
MPATPQVLDSGSETRTVQPTEAISLDTARDELAVASRDADAQASDLADACELVIEFTDRKRELCQRESAERLAAFVRIQAGLARLARLPTAAQLLQATPSEVCRCCEFDRAAVFRVRGSTLVPDALHVTDGENTEQTRLLKAYWKCAEIPLTLKLVETEMVRRGAPAMVTDPQSNRHTYTELMKVSQTRAYVAAAVKPGSRVVGLLHADCFSSGREIVAADRDNLSLFASGFARIFERAVVRERLAEQLSVLGDVLSPASLPVGLESHARIARPAGTAVGRSPVGFRLQTVLTSREREILDLIVAGGCNREIASRLVISEETVKTHVKNARTKLRAPNRAAAVSRYVQLLMRERS